MKTSVANAVICMCCIALLLCIVPGAVWAGGAESSRQWTDSTGSHRIRASLIEREGDSVRLKTESGEIITIALEKLSRDDREYVERTLAPQQESSLSNSLDSLHIELVNQADTSLVHVVTDAGTANGFCVRTREGKRVIVTCYRGIAGTPSANVVLADGKTFAVNTCLAYDAGRELLLLAVPDHAQLTGLSLASEDCERLAVISFVTSPGTGGDLRRRIRFETQEGKVGTMRTTDFWTELNEGLDIDDECSRLGLSPTTRWLSSSLPVCGENRGNPLIDLTGRVVGVNSWSRITNSLEFHQVLPPSELHCLLKEEHVAVPLTELEPYPIILAGSKYVKRVKWMSAPRVGRGTKDTTHCHHIEFYSGADVTVDPLPVWDKRLSTFDEYKEDFFGEGFNKKGNIDGLVGGVLAEANNIRFLETFRDGEKHGLCYVWHKGATPVMQCEYAHDKRDGYCCYLRSIQEQDENRLTCLFVVEYEKGIRRKIHHLSNDGNDVLATYDDVEGLKAVPNTLEAWKTAIAIEDDLAAAERAMRKEVRKIVEEARQRKASALNVRKRNAMSKRASERRARNSRIIEQMRRASQP